MDCADALWSQGSATAEAAGVDPGLNADMRLSFELEIALASILTLVVLERALDVARVSIMPLDEIRVVAVHRTDQVGERCEQTRRKAAAEPGRLLRQIERKIRQLPTVAGAFPDQEWLH